MSTQARLTPVPDALVGAVAVMEHITCAAVNCRDYDHYKSLPEVVSYNGMLLGKTGWNSDRDMAYYQSNATILQTVRK